MRKSIGSKVFIMTMGLFFLVLLIHFLLFSRLFNNIYMNSMLAAYREELFQATRSFVGGTEDSSNAGLREYAAQTGSPVLAFDQEYQICDGEFFNQLGIVSVRGKDGKVLHLPIHYVYSLIDYPRFSLAQQVRILAVPLGEGPFYEPIVIAADGRAFTNGGSAAAYRDGDAAVSVQDVSGFVEQTRYLQPGEDIFTSYAAILYDQVKDCLVLRQDIGEFMAGINEKAVFDRYGNEYRVFTETLTRGENTFYFASLRRIFFTGQEKSYLNNLFFGIYAVLGVLLILSAILLSRYFSRPLRYLSEVTKKIASLDFSETARIRGDDELGRLAENINTMSHNLERALEGSWKNEKRMKVLLADLAHEFKTPLGLIQMYTGMLERGLFDDDPAAYYSKLETEVFGLTRMVNDVIELSKLQSGSWRVEAGVWRLNDIIDPVIEGFEPQLRQGGYTLETGLMEVDVRADARRIGQVLSNLLSNAMKYTDRRRRVAITVRPEQPGCVEVSVCNGGHLSEEDRVRIWERYYSTDSMTPARLPSDGIGLDIVRSILTAHGSRYGVRMEGGNVCFYFSLDRSDSGEGGGDSLSSSIL